MFRCNYCTYKKLENIVLVGLHDFYKINVEVDVRVPFVCIMVHVRGVFFLQYPSVTKQAIYSVTHYSCSLLGEVSCVGNGLTVKKIEGSLSVLPSEELGGSTPIATTNKMDKPRKNVQGLVGFWMMDKRYARKRERSEGNNNDNNPFWIVGHVGGWRACFGMVG